MRMTIGPLAGAFCRCSSARFSRFGRGWAGVDASVMAGVPEQTRPRCPAREARARRSAGSAQFGRLGSRPVRGPALAIAGVSAEKRATSRRLLWSSKLLVRCFDSCSLLSSLSGVLCRASPQVKKRRHLASRFRPTGPEFWSIVGGVAGAYNAGAVPKIAERKLEVPVLGFICGCFLLEPRG
jgi:hypothetical protein